MTFTNHVKQIKDKMMKRLNAINVLSNKSWGSKTEDLRTLYIGYVRSVAEYAGAAWISGASEISIKQIATQQNAGARLITGCLRSTPIHALLAEANPETDKSQRQNHGNKCKGEVQKR